MGQFLWICLGGAVGTGARFALATWCRNALGASFPYGTLAVNVIGSFLLGVIMHAGLHAEVISPAARLTLGTGVMGGFTTYSTFNYEALRYFEERAFLLGAAYLVATLLGCMVAGWLGVSLARRLWVV